MQFKIIRKPRYMESNTELGGPSMKSYVFQGVKFT